MSEISVSIIQMQVQLENKGGNLAHAKDLIETACLSRPDIILLPEAFNVGFFPQEPINFADDMRQGESWGLLSNLAKEHQVNIVGGSVVRLSPDGRVVNTMYIFDRQGREIASYDKIHLFSYSGENEVFTPGQKPCLFKLEGLTMGGIICYDIRFTELVRGLALLGAKVLFVPAQWPHPRSEHWRILVRARAIENQQFVVAANACGPMGGVVNCGYSAIVDPWGQVLAEAGEEEIILNVNLDLAKVRTVRQRIVAYQDRRPKIYKELLQKGMNNQ